MDLIHTREQADNGYKKYLKSRPGASKESVKRARDYKDMKIGCHPALKTAAIDFEEENSGRKLSKAAAGRHEVAGQDCGRVGDGRQDHGDTLRHLQVSPGRGYRRSAGECIILDKINIARGDAGQV